MASEAGHHPNRVYIGQDGSLYLNGAKLYNNDGDDVSTALGQLDTLSTAELAVIDGVTAGTITASKAVIVDASKDISGFRKITMAGTTGQPEVILPDNLADALSVKISGGADYLVFDSTDTDEKLTILSAVTQKLGFYGTTPVVQPAGANQAALTNSTGGAYDGTLAAVGATNAGDESAAINNNFTDLHTLLNEIRTALVNLGVIKGAA
jgi:hypothetical protein